MKILNKIAINTICILLCLICLLIQYRGLPIDNMLFIFLSIANLILLIGNIIEWRRQKQLTDFLAEKRDKL